ERNEGGAARWRAPAGGGGGRKFEPGRGGSASLDQPPGAGPVVGGRAIDGGPTAAVRNPGSRRWLEPAVPPGRGVTCCARRTGGGARGGRTTARGVWGRAGGPRTGAE